MTTNVKEVSAAFTAAIMFAVILLVPSKTHACFFGDCYSYSGGQQSYYVSDYDYSQPSYYASRGDYNYPYESYPVYYSFYSPSYYYSSPGYNYGYPHYSYPYTTNYNTIGYQSDSYPPSTGGPYSSAGYGTRNFYNNHW